MGSTAIIVVLVVMVAAGLLGGAVWWLVSRRPSKGTEIPRVAVPVIAAPDRTAPTAEPESQPEPKPVTPAEPELEALPVEVILASGTISQPVKEVKMPEEAILTTPATDPAAAVYDSPEAVVAAEPLVEDPEPEFDLSRAINLVETSPPTHRGELL